MSLVPSFARLVQAVAVAMTAPTRITFELLVGGWLFARRRTVTQILACSGSAHEKHFCSFHRFFSAASWSLDALGMYLFQVVEPFVDDGAVFLAVDDTLARKRGRKIFGVGWHHDPLLKNVKAKTSWGHSWVVLGVIVRFPSGKARTFCLPLLFRLYLNREQALKQRRVYRTRPQLAVEMVRKLCAQRPTRRFHLLGDAVYGGRSVRDRLPPQCDLTSTLRLDARLYDVPPSNQIRNGRYCRRGERLPSPQEKLQERLRRMEVSVYGRRDHVRIGSYVGRPFHEPERALRVVVIESLDSSRGQQAYYSTVVAASDEQILKWYAMRWCLEVAFQSAKQQLGFEQPPSWTKKSVERTAPMAMVIYSLVVLWFETAGKKTWKLRPLPWQSYKTQPSFADMLTTLRRQNVLTHLKSLAIPPQERRQILKILENSAALAA